MKTLKKLAFLFCAPLVASHGDALFADNGVKSSEKSDFTPGENSARLVFELGTPRRFAARFLKDERMLQLRVIPGNAAEFEASKYYDDRYIQRVVVKEEAGEVIVSLQLKSIPLGWTVAHQDSPWRLLIDIWNTEENRERRSLDARWTWQEDFASRTAPVSQELARMPSSFIKEDKGAHEQTEMGHGMALAIREDGTQGKGSIAIPENFGRLDAISQGLDSKIIELRRKAGELLGHDGEYAVGLELANTLYRAGKEADGLAVFRRLALLSERQFKENPKTLWVAGECAFLSKSIDLALDYYRALVLNHGGHELRGLAAMRLNDIEYLTSPEGRKLLPFPESIATKYAEYALSEKSPWQARIASSVRLLYKNVDKNPEAAKLYQQNIDACVNRSVVPLEMRKNCAYISTRYAVDRLDAVSADSEVQRFRKFSPEDSRLVGLEKLLQKNVRSFLEDSHRNKAWESWVGFERKARPQLLDFTLKESELVFWRAESWEAVGEERTAAQLYSLYWQNSADEKRRNIAAALAAKLLRRSGESSKSDLFLKRIEKSEIRKSSGLGDRAVGALKQIALSPYRNKVALQLLLDEMRAGWYVERDLLTLKEFAAMVRRNPAADTVYEKILAYPTKSEEDAKMVENAILQYADDLRDEGRVAKSADMYFAVAGLAQGKRRAEAAYKAGVVYARAGLLEKARTSWQMAASDVSDKRYSTLASERLDRIR